MQATVELLELVVLYKPARKGNTVTQRTVTGDDQVQSLRRVEQLEHSLLRRETAGIEHLSWLGLRANVGGHLDAVRDYADVDGA